MTRSLILLGTALAAVCWLIRQPAFAHDTPHKQTGALIAITVPFLALDIILAVRKKRRARARAMQPQTGIRARARAGRW
jgi:hypothetical protein